MKKRRTAGESMSEGKPLMCGASTFLSVLIETPTGQIVKWIWEVRQLTRATPRCPCETLCAILSTGVERPEAHQSD